MRNSIRFISSTALLVAAAACGREREGPLSGAHAGPRPEVMPVVMNEDLPFRYPTALFAQQVQGNVTMRIFIDAEGKVVMDSTRVVETSGYTALDSAAVKGSEELRFVPAKRRGEPMPVSILFPVYFRHPEAAPLPGDTVLPQPEK
ncbi:MAG TPA: energy transducer TonB [Gemmatimonadaceae bacterium]|nr:energy transducer TonB [Gemmatimonadaceae bacterium]